MFRSARVLALFPLLVASLAGPARCEELPPLIPREAFTHAERRGGMASARKGRRAGRGRVRASLRCPRVTPLTLRQHGDGARSRVMSPQRTTGDPLLAPSARRDPVKYRVVV